MMYRSTAHSVTGVSPAKLLYGREIRTKVPNLCEFSLDDTEVRDRDSEQKEKGKVYADQKRNAQKCDLQEGDKVLVRQEKENKLSTTFHPNPMTVVERNRNAVLLESDQGVHYKRNITHVKKFFESQNEEQNESFPAVQVDQSGSRDHIVVSDNPNAEINISDNTCTPKSSHIVPDSSQNVVVESRPVRVRKMPAKYDDFYCWLVNFAKGHLFLFQECHLTIWTLIEYFVSMLTLIEYCFSYQIFSVA